jgi:hypothetical protein
MLQDPPNDSGKGNLKRSILKREVDAEFWKKVLRLSCGGLQDKKECGVKILTDNWRLPEEADEIVKQLARSGEKEIQIEIAKVLSKGPRITFGLHMDLLDALTQASNPEIDAILSEDLKRYKSISVALTEIERRIATFNVISTVSQDPRVLYEWSANLARSVHTVPRTLSQYIVGYYTDTEVNKQKEESKKALATSKHHLLVGLDSCVPGPSKWVEYENIVRDILEYTLVPPLSRPHFQSRTATGIHRRDIIIHIPSDVEGFWRSISDRFDSWAIIVDAKNYSEEVSGSDVFETSKYLAKEKLGRFGIVVTRKGLDNGARTQQRSLWTIDKKMIVCLNDEDLGRMIGLRMTNNDPGSVLDEKVRTFLESLE